MRPKIPADKRKTNQIVFRLTDSERETLDKLAKQANCTPSEYIREAIIQQQPLLETLIAQKLQVILEDTIQKMTIKEFKAYKNRIKDA